MPTATSHTSAGTRAGKPSAPANDLPTKVDAEGVGEIGAHPSRIPTAGPILQVGRVLAPSGASCSRLCATEHKQADHLAKNRHGPLPRLGEGHVRRSRASTISPTPLEI